MPIEDFILREDLSKEYYVKQIGLYIVIIILKGFIFLLFIMI